MSHGYNRRYIEVRVRGIVNEQPPHGALSGKDMTEIKVQALIAQALFAEGDAEGEIDMCEVNVVAELGSNIVINENGFAVPLDRLERKVPTRYDS